MPLIHWLTGGRSGKQSPAHAEGLAEGVEDDTVTSNIGLQWRRGEERRGKERRGEERKGEERRGKDRRGEERRGEGGGRRRML